MSVAAPAIASTVFLVLLAVPGAAQDARASPQVPTAAPDASALAGIKAPVIGFYGGDDARVTSTVDATKAEMQKLGRAFEAEIYPGAGHGFLRQQDGRDGANDKATRAAWPRTIEFLRKNTK
jgi:dienelactone hydrolase